MNIFAFNDIISTVQSGAIESKDYSDGLDILKSNPRLGLLAIDCALSSDQDKSSLLDKISNEVFTEYKKSKK